MKKLLPKYHEMGIQSITMFDF